MIIEWKIHIINRFGEKNQLFFGFKIQKCGEFPKLIKKYIVQLRFEYVVDTQNTFHDDENPLHNLFCRKIFIYVKIQIFKFSKLQKNAKKRGNNISNVYFKSFIGCIIEK